MSHGSRDRDNHQPTPDGDAFGPLQRRLRTGAQPLGATEAAPSTSQAAQADDPGLNVPEAIAYATLGLLDGTVIARLPCGEELGTATIGRGSLSDILVHDPWIHREHAYISWDLAARAHTILHAGGANGTFVNLQRVSSSTPARLADGARVRVGKTELVYRRVL